jgi:Flp pilus assembly pilin Flp
MKHSSGFLAGLRRFLGAEDGPLRVEWVGLTGVIIIAAVAIGYTIMNQTKDSAANVGGRIESATAAKYSNF